MATAKRLPSGNYRVQVYDYTDSSGKKHYKSFTAPTKKEAELLALTNNRRDPSDLTLLEAIDKFCDDKRNVFSPSSIKGYKGCKQSIEPIGNKSLAKINYTILQGYINDLSKTKSPKTVKNIYGLITSVLKHNGYKLDKDVSLPKQKKRDYLLPTEDDLKEILEYTKEKDFELYKAICLGSIALMRRSEICALHADDITRNTIHINKAVVLNDNNEWVLKGTKTYSSDRYVTVPQALIDILPKEGQIVNATPAYISDHFRRIVTKFGKKGLRFHDLRHYGASLMHSIGIPDQYIMSQGGWSSDFVLKNIYRNTLPDYQKEFTKMSDKEFSKLIK